MLIYRTPWLWHRHLYLALSLIYWLICQHRWAATVSSAAAVWSCSRIVSGVDNLIQLHERRVVILILGDSRAARSIVVQPRAVDCHGAGLHVVSETHTRPSWEPIHVCCCFRTERRLSPRHPDGRQGEVGHRCRILHVGLLPATTPVWKWTSSVC